MPIKTFETGLSGLLMMGLILSFVLAGIIWAYKSIRN